MAPNRRDISFKTKDGLTLKGWLYPSGEKAPCVIMSHGVGPIILPSNEQHTDPHFSWLASKNTTLTTLRPAFRRPVSLPSSTTTVTGARAKAPRASRSTRTCSSRTTSTPSTTLRHWPISTVTDTAKALCIRSCVRDSLSIKQNPLILQK
jgi:hypothetical protein